MTTSPPSTSAKCGGGGTEILAATTEATCSHQIGAFGVSVASTKDARLAEQIGGTARVLTQPVS